VSCRSSSAMGSVRRRSCPSRSSLAPGTTACSG
jgi:hypothetical protein